MAGEASSQLLLFSSLFSLTAGAVILMGSGSLLRLIFGRVEPEVMEACMTYLQISACSYPMLAVYQAGASVYRSMGKTSTTMYISIVSNIINMVGNCTGVFVLHAGVAGVAYPSLIARTVSAVWITALCFSRKKSVHYRMEWILHWNPRLLRKILGIAIPNGVDNGVFQLVKVALSSIVALFAVGLGLGVMGIAWAMCADWTVRGLIFLLRLRSGAWKNCQVI